MAPKRPISFLSAVKRCYARHQAEFLEIWKKICTFPSKVHTFLPCFHELIRNKSQSCISSSCSFPIQLSLLALLEKKKPRSRWITCQKSLLGHKTKRNLGVAKLLHNIYYLTALSHETFRCWLRNSFMQSLSTSSTKSIGSASGFICWNRELMPSINDTPVYKPKQNNLLIEKSPLKS